MSLPSHPLRRRLHALTTRSYHTLRAQPLAELAGALGDLGTLLPLLTALARQGSVKLSTTLLASGLANVATGLLFGVPLPVQPMKAIAAVALARGFDAATTAAAGIVVGAALLMLALTGGVAGLARVVPVPVVKGVQVGAGLSLCLSAGAGLLGGLGWTGPWWGDNWAWAVGFVGLMCVTSRCKAFPVALGLFVWGLVVAGVRMRMDGGGDGGEVEGPTVPPVLRPGWRTFVEATVTASLGQLPLTLLNSVLAVSHLSKDLLPDVPEPGVTALALSVGVTNVMAPWFGAMPVCHGSGGLAGQYRFGARSGASVVVLGLAKMLLGLGCVLAGPAGVLEVLRAFPKSVLGVMVLASGIELAGVVAGLCDGARDLVEEGEDGRKIVRTLGEEEKRERWSVLLVTVAGLLAFRNDGVGFVAGMVWWWGGRAVGRLRERWGARRDSRDVDERTALLA